MAEGLPTILVENSETVGSLATLVVLLLFRYWKGEWPLLSNLRRKFLPFLHNIVMEPVGGYAAREQSEEEFVGTYDITKKKLKNKYRSHKQVFPNNFASIKFRFINGEKQYEDYSWALRKDGITDDEQTHLTVYENRDGTVDVYAHFEYNPIPSPVPHYEGSGEIWDVQKGVDNAQILMMDLGVQHI